MANTAGDKVSASDFNALFTRLNTVRKKQYARADVTASNLSSTWSGPASVGAKPVPANVQQLKTYVSNLESGVSNISGFSSKITVPTVGQLLQASTITLMETAVKGVEGACVNCSHDSFDGFNGNDGFDGFHGNDGFDGFNGNNSHQPTCFSNWGSNCSWF